MRIGRVTALFCLLGGAAIADPQLTTIQDTIFKADGTKFNGTAVISWNSFQAADNTNVGMQTVSVSITNGAIYVQLIPNSTAVPPYPYIVTYSSDGRVQYQETWVVPSSVTPLYVRDVRTSTTAVNPPIGAGGAVTSPGGAGGTTTESSVVGLTNDLAARPVKGPSYGSGRVALVDTSGAIDTVVGNSTDCVYVDGSTGPCFDSTQLPTYSDAEIPSGTVDGVNTTYILSGTPSPAASLLLFRNGMIQKPALDYTLTGTTVSFGVGNGPQPGDTIVAWYRKGSAAAGGGQAQAHAAVAGANFVSSSTPQVLCSAAGAQTSTTTLASLGTCTIPAGTLGAGDRVDVRFLFSHTGKASAWTFLVKWGSTALVQRTANAIDTAASGRADAAIPGSGNTLFSGETFSATLPIAAFLGSASDAISGAIKLDFQAALTTTGSDSANLANFTVLRYPALSHP